jgi:hypothetical protein
MSTNSEKPHYYLYNDIPGVHHSWTLAVYAMTRQDANEYMKCYHHGGRFVSMIESGSVKADCGATTERAHQWVKEYNARYAY